MGGPFQHIGGCKSLSCTMLCGVDLRVATSKFTHTICTSGCRHSRRGVGGKGGREREEGGGGPDLLCRRGQQQLAQTVGHCRHEPSSFPCPHSQSCQWSYQNCFLDAYASPETTPFTLSLLHNGRVVPCGQP